MAKYLVTGGAGFIGSHLAEAVVKRGEKVVVVDDLSTGRLENLKGFLDKVELVQGDVCDMSLMNHVMKGVDYVMHEAAIPSVPRSVKEPLKCNRAAVDGTLSVLLAARDAGVKRLVYASSSSVYGETEILPKVEVMPSGPISPYAVAKLAGELYTKVFWRVYGLETVSLRYFNVFGPRQDPNSMYSGVIVKFIRALARGETPVIFGDGTQTRDFTYIGNVVRANLQALEVPTGPAIGMAFNVGTGLETELNELLETIARAMGKPATARHEPGRPDDIQHSLADITLARRFLKYSPETTLEKGITETVRYYVENER
jgi:nucleoside-diphosphate-sugar epimerase